MKKLTILGSTGSIGTQSLEVVKRFQDEFSVVGLSARRNIELLARQAAAFNAKTICILESELKDDLYALLSNKKIEILTGRQGLLDLAGRDDIDLLVNGLVGAAGMQPTINAVTAGVNVALSNKESLVMAGAVIQDLMAQHDVELFPIDSEHSAIWQCLRGEKSSQIRRLILTGSGGPFRTLPLSAFSSITKARALQHPNWNMGAKITIDSATMMNKGLEVIEAHWLFGLPADRIDIVVHPQSVIHSMVEFADGSVKAQLGVPDMKIPIQYALAYPDHLPADWERIDFVKIGSLQFEEPDLKKFPCIRLAYDALQTGGTLPAVLNVANDLAVTAFLEDKIGFTGIPEIIESVIDRHETVMNPSLEDIDLAAEWAYKKVQKLIKG
ncbi:MAG: 1-deoxy-D-xylulose-5-phosphate reductoisomerase [FCB group bacterium]|nr:1-deoxy-D-xylulose-5-phosphate reductoisomerase [FCB group bacterium]